MDYIVSDEDVSKRLDVFLTSKLDNITRSYVKNLIDSVDITVNGKMVKAGYILKKNDKVTVNIPKLRSLDVCAEDIKLNIIYEDDDVIIVKKKEW